MLNYLSYGDIFIIDISIFEDIKGYELIERKLTNKEQYREAVFYDDKFIDINDYDIIHRFTKNNEGLIDSDIYSNLKYAQEVYTHPHITRKVYKRALEAIKVYEARKELEKSRKLVPFENRSLH